MRRGANAYWIVEYDSTNQIAKVKRTEAPFASTADMEAAFDLLRTTFAGVERGRHALLFDIRVGPMKNEPVFERAFARQRREITSGWRGVIVLVQSAIGLVQVQRHGREDGLDYFVTTDEAEALERARILARSGIR